MRSPTISALALIIFALAGYSTALAHDVSRYAVGVGYYDVIGADDSAADVRLEYRSGTSFLADDLHPWVGAEITSDATMWAGAGLLYDWNIAPGFYIIPSFGAGLYTKGSSDKDLDFPLEFRSQIEGAYEFEDQSRLSLAFGHISNASLGDKNPGVEILTLYYHVPTGNLFSSESEPPSSSLRERPITISRQASPHYQSIDYNRKNTLK